MSIELTNTTRQRLPNIPYEDVVLAICGKKMDISMVFVGTKRARKINIAQRNKNYIPNVLAFPLSKHSGEIFICLKEAKKQAPKFDLNYTQFVLFLFIHALLHVQGYDHGDAMETLEKKYMKQFCA